MNGQTQATELSAEAGAYFDELAAEIVLNGNPGGDLITEARPAHERRQAFALEMHAGETDRAKMAREAIGTYIFLRIQKEQAIDRLMRKCEQVAA